MSLGSKGYTFILTCNSSSVSTKYFWTKDDKLKSMYPPPHPVSHLKALFAKLSAYLLENLVCTAIFKTKKTA